MFEKDIKRQILNWLLRRPKTYCWTQASVGIYDHNLGFFRSAPKKGIPDIICCIDGKFVGIEVKRPGNKLSEAQKGFKAGIELAGGVYAVVFSLEETKRLFS